MEPVVATTLTQPHQRAQAIDQVVRHPIPVLGRGATSILHVCAAIWFLLAGPSKVLSGGSTNLPVREANATLRMPASLIPEEPKHPYRLVEAFEGLSFEDPVAATSPPGDTERLFVVERAGRIVVITNLAAPSSTVFLDISGGVVSDWTKQKVEGLTSLAFHPGYLTNRFPQFFVSYTAGVVGTNGYENYNRLSRFQSSRATPDQASPDSEVRLLDQIDHGDGHNFNDLAFGPDGYLYLSVGDEGDGGTGDDFNNAQRIDKNYFSGILRLDVDKQPGNLLPNPHPANTDNYFVPADNPWVGATNFNGKSVDPRHVRTEFYAVGLRNPWRMAFDLESGLLYEGDVGQHGREEVNIIVKGGNYGWSFREGTLKGPKSPIPDGVEFINPIYQYGPGYGPDQGFSITGGRVYRGQALPELQGAYVFADYVSGNVWSIRYDGTNAAPAQRLTAHTGIVGFGVDPRDGELLIIDHDRGKIMKLERVSSDPGPQIPLTLADTGAFADLQSLKPEAGILPYEVNVPFWSDGAHKQRWFSLPQTNQTIVFGGESNWLFPKGTVWIKHFELTNAFPEPVRRLETRLLVKTTDGMYGVTYRWDDSMTNAVLVPEEGLNEAILVSEGGMVRTQTWHYPSRMECLACHTPVAGYALGFHTPQLNRLVAYGDVVTNQILALNSAGYFGNSVSNVHALPALASFSNTELSREFRVRSYLAANCVSCHQPRGPAHAQWDARITTPLPETGLIEGEVYDNLGDPDARLIKPGSPDHSMVLTRISDAGVYHMPPIGGRRLNQEAIDQVRAWIAEDLAGVQTYASWQQRYFTNAVPEEFTLPEADPDQDGAVNYLEYLTERHPLDSADLWQLNIHKTNDVVQILFPQVANRLFQVQWSDELTPPVPWRVLDVAENRFFPAATNQLRVIQDPSTNNAARYYRISVREP